MSNEAAGEAGISTDNSQQKENILGIIDLGSNSARLMLVRILPNNSFFIVNQVKQMVRLGEHAFATKQLQEAPILATLQVLKAFKEMCQEYGVEQIIAIATAAVRHAENSKDFIQRAQKETGIHFKVISGLEEARLIYLGISRSLHYSMDLRFFIDIGGGSTELIAGNSEKYMFLDSLSLGCVSLTNRFLSGHTGKVQNSLYKEMQEYVRQASAHALQNLRIYQIKKVIASSGTAQSIYNLSWKMQLGISSYQEQDTLSFEGIKLVSKYICDLTLEERKALPSINPSRAEVLVAGIVILHTLCEELGLKQVAISPLNLQNGILIDFLEERNNKEISLKNKNREQSIFGLAKACQYEEKHAKHVSALALMIHDSAVDCGLIAYNSYWRELLYYAGILHDIGILISYTHHHQHSYYMIKNSDLLGFSEEEKEHIALLAMYHGKKPSKKHQFFQSADDEVKTFLPVYALFLALAENMDRLHRQYVYEAGFMIEENTLLLYAQVASKSASSMIEESSVLGMEKNIEKVFQRAVSIHFST